MSGPFPGSTWKRATFWRVSPTWYTLLPFSVPLERHRLCVKTVDEILTSAKTYGLLIQSMTASAAMDKIAMMMSAMISNLIIRCTSTKSYDLMSLDLRRTPSGGGVRWQLWPALLVWAA